jgi:hypothetical protein
MSNYTNITLYGVTQEEAADWCAENGVVGYISPTVDDVTVLYENTLAENAHLPQPLEALLARAATMSAALMSPALVSVVMKDHMFMYVLYLDGGMKDSYMSYTDKPPANGSTDILVRTFDAEGEEARVTAALRREYISAASERHMELMDALALPPMMIDMGFAYLEEGEKPHGVEDNNDVIFIGPPNDAEGASDDGDIEG